MAGDIIGIEDVAYVMHQPGHLQLEVYGGYEAEPVGALQVVGEGVNRFPGDALGRGAMPAGCQH
ncbi:MAG: hypothetical protein M3535_10320 [Actinomycetota bacterium]|nr:hypothetical protein [Actinomycetota bacterium]